MKKEAALDLDSEDHSLFAMDLREVEVAPQDGAIDYAAGRELLPASYEDVFGALLDSHLTTRYCNEESDTLPRLSRREQEQLRTLNYQFALNQ